MPSLHALEDAGGLDALYVEPGVSNASSTSDTGTPVTISARDASTGHTPSSAIDARLYTITWDDDSALALIFSGTAMESADVAAAIAQARRQRPSRRRSATPMPRNSAPSSTPRPTAS